MLEREYQNWSVRVRVRVCEGGRKDQLALHLVEMGTSRSIATSNFEKVDAKISFFPFNMQRNTGYYKMENVHNLVDSHLFSQFIEKMIFDIKKVEVHHFS